MAKVTSTSDDDLDLSPHAFNKALGALEQRILSGELRVGDRLAPERILALQLGVSRSAVREAIRALAAQGVVEANVGTGPRAGTRVTARRGEALVRLLQLQVALAQFPVDDVVTARVALERASASLATEHRSEAELAELTRLVVAMDSTSIDIDTFNELDTAFHVGIAAAARSSLIGDLGKAVRLSLAGPILAAERRLTDWDGFRAGLAREHAEILQAIRDGDASLAEDLVEHHTRHAFAALRLAGNTGLQS